MSGLRIPKSSLRLILLAVVVWGYLLANVSAVPATDHKPLNSQVKEDDGKKTGVDAWGWEIWLLVIGGAIVGFIVLSCLISYMFCACAKEIICLPFTCLSKVLCCCCD